MAENPEHSGSGPRWSDLRGRPRVGVIGGSRCEPSVAALARRVGETIARSGAVLVCGGLGGVMEEAARGARESGGLTVGILPGEEAGEANPCIDLPLATGLGHARNLVIVRACDGLVAVDGAYGTLTEIAFALLYDRPLAGVRTWEVDPRVVPFEEPEEAVRWVLEKIRGGRS
jgi:uncharacterized protein (TIGR00725 family)